MTAETLWARARWRADPLADDVISRIAGPDPTDVQGDALSAAKSMMSMVDRLRLASQAMAQWTTNDSLATWQPSPDLPADIGAALQDYLRQAAALPAWADAAKVARAEQVFLDHGVLSCALLFCASLPQCYVLPDLAAVLQSTAQLTERTEHRIRSTAAMIFPVMLPGGLMTGDGSGVAQVLKVRLIHATVRHLVLRRAPSENLQAVSPWPEFAQMDFGTERNSGMSAMHRALASHGWDVPAQGLPCNQIELVYTLLTFHYVFLQGLRDLHVPLDAPSEQAYLHTWSVVGHVLGIEPELMPHTMDEARSLFARLQEAGRAHEATRLLQTRRDDRPALGQALMQFMAEEISVPLFQPIPLLMTRFLCGPATSRDIGIAQVPVPWTSRLLFIVAMGIARLIDGVMRLFSPQFSISRFLTRLVGYPLVTQLMLDQTRPLNLPKHLHDPVLQAVLGWRTDPQAPRWLNAVGSRLNTAGQRLAAAKQAGMQPAK